MDIEKLRNELYAANENRAIIYYLLFDELRAELGEERAMGIFKRAIYRRGQQIGDAFARFAPDDLRGLCDSFLKGIPDSGKMFAPTVLRCDAEALELRFDHCPLKNAWKKMGLPPEECAKICEIAAMVDYGTFESAGFDFTLRALREGEEHSCYLTIRPGTAQND